MLGTALILILLCDFILILYFMISPAKVQVFFMNESGDFAILNARPERWPNGVLAVSSEIPDWVSDEKTTHCLVTVIHYNHVMNIRFDPPERLRGRIEINVNAAGTGQVQFTDGPVRRFNAQGNI